eukprot:CAMPEP_0206233668 /NCGR_PEP_ID=MMETSP0047_2-20121206/12146_1 /ASSEMBLY_ACC=CAM_ASM_000192 /TAXON_ID=195065 /ORGANISM="Chroomonas mesostigmatica_cf, Strain CCMP1168" /LENGTH=79 /DNA_ID=CAMNT_0053657635 /DNA_START=17 /DNA_END=252 /DNA_ORIENTATION=-
MVPSPTRQAKTLRNSPRRAPPLHQNVPAAGEMASLKHLMYTPCLHAWKSSCAPACRAQRARAHAQWALLALRRAHVHSL